MPQNPIPANVSVRSSFYAPMQLDSTSQLDVEAGGAFSVLNVTQATVIKATPGRLRKVFIVNAGSGGTGFTINDAVSTGTSTTTGSTQSNVAWFMTQTSATTVAASGTYI